MQDIKQFGVTPKELNDINTNLNGVNKKSRDYIKDIVFLINKEVGINKILSILLFGSQKSKNKENTDISDCDILIIFKDRVSNRHIKEIERYFIALEIKHDFREFNSHLFNKILFVIQQTSGMFISHFLTKKKYFINANFHKIFRVNKVFSKLFAPKRIVMASVIDNSEMLYGEDLRTSIKHEVDIPPFDMIKSVIMNLMISLFSLLISPLKSSNSIKYQLEAVKWAIKASNYYIFEDSKSLEEIIRRFVLFEKYPFFKRRALNYYKRFLNLRKDLQLDLGFMLRSPFRIVKIHVKGFLFKKIRILK